MNIKLISQIIITDNFNYTIEILKKSAPKDTKFELFLKENSNFLVNDANEVIAKAYLASKEKTFICLCSQTFSDIVQNRLLKIIEEPPKNKEFILITSSKSALLPTIKSRLPITIIKNNKKSIELNLDISNLDLQTLYNFVQESKRLKPKEAIPIIEEITKQALKSNKYNIDNSLLDTFTNARIALELGAIADFTITYLLLKLLAKKVKN